MVPSACCSLSGIAHASQNSPGRPGEVAACRPRLCGIRGGAAGLRAMLFGERLRLFGPRLGGGGAGVARAGCATLSKGHLCEGTEHRSTCLGSCRRCPHSPGNARAPQVMPKLPRPCPSSPSHARAPQAMPELPRPCPCLYPLPTAPSGAPDATTQAALAPSGCRGQVGCRSLPPAPCCWGGLENGKVQSLGAGNPSRAGRECAQGLARSSQALLPRISCPWGQRGGLGTGPRGGLKLEGPSYSCQGKASPELSPSCTHGEQTWECAPRAASREKLWELSVRAEFRYGRAKNKPGTKRGLNPQGGRKEAKP